IENTPRSMAGAFKLELTPDGGFVVMGSATTSGERVETSGGEFLLKFTSTGHVDTTFGRNGVVKPESISTFAVDSQGRVLVGGYHPHEDNPAVTDATLTRYNPDGRIDTGFSNAGQFIVLATNADPDLNDLNFNGIDVDSQGRILASMLTVKSRVLPEVTIYRLNNNGKVDRTYARDGKAHILDTLPSDDRDPVEDYREVARALDDGSVLLRGEMVTKLDPNGHLDANYGHAGVTDSTHLPIHANDSLSTRTIYNQFAFTADGSVVLADHTRSGALQLTRLNAQGHEDPSFGVSGSIWLEGDDDPNAAGELRGIDLAADGSIVAGGLSGILSPTGRTDTRQFVTGRTMGGAGPAVQFVPLTLNKPSTYLYITVYIRDPDGVDFGTLDNDDLKLFDASGNTRKFQFSSSEDVNGGGKYIATRYRIKGPNNTAWSSAANGTYEVRLQRKQIVNLNGNAATAQPVGTLRVNIG
ncbi:MAG TPA: hypothetical protein VL282_14645, partial [Tepidisphaeraceae bacterium]|nr:hypothetical protein [Tepidisphaeraceae bacterium]